MPGCGYGSRKKAIGAALAAMRSSIGEGISFEPVLPTARFPEMFRVLDGQGRHLKSLRVFKVGSGLQEWAWEELPRS